MDPGLIEQAITPRTKAVVPVHLYGQTADMDRITAIAREHGLLVVEDACQAHGAEYRGKRAGSLGDAAAFSFYPGKNLGAYGEAGAVVTGDRALAERIAVVRDHGQTRKYHHEVVGWNARMDGLQGAILSVKLGHLDEWTGARRAAARLYDELLSGVEGILRPEEADYAKHVYHIYAVRLAGRDRVLEALKERDVFCGIHYPVPVHLLQAYAGGSDGRGGLPVTEACASECLSLPLYPEITEQQIRHVVESLGAVVNEVGMTSRRGAI